MRFVFPCQAAAPWHFLYFLPLPHGHGSLRPTFGSSRLTVLITSSPPVRLGRGGSATAVAPPPRIAPNGDDCDGSGRALIVICDGRRGAGRRTGAPGPSSPTMGVRRHKYRTISSSIRSFIALKSWKLSFLYSTSGSRWP